MPYDPNKPYANNKFSSAGVFFNRELYKARSYPDQQDWQPKPLDLWDTHGLYGRVNSFGDAIEPANWELKQILSTKSDDVYVLNFVADAFEDLKSYMTKAGFQNRIEKEKTNYYDLQPERGWKDLNVAFENYNEALYDAFFGFMSDKKIDEKLIGFPSFLKLFSILVDRITPNFTFTKSGFAVSGMNDPMSCGLMLEFATEKHDEDQVKYQKYIKDVNFTFFSNATKKFGFLIDKNAPWRIIADVASAPMQKYMEAYQISIDNLFQVGYGEVYKVDIPNMTSYLIRFYNSYVAAKPEARINKPSQTSRGLLSRTVYKRIQINEIDPNEFDNMYWLKYYAYIRAKELGRTWRQVTFNRLIKTANQILRLQGYDDALDFLNRRLRGAQPKLLPLTSDAAHDKIKFDFESKSIFQPFRLF